MSTIPRKMSILAVTNTYPTEKMPGDTPCIKDQILALQAYGIKVDLLYVDRTQGKTSYLRAAWSLFLKSFQRRHYDLIHAYYGHCGLLARLQIKYPIVVTFRGSDLLSKRDGLIGKLVARWVDAIIVMSEEMARIANRQDASIIPFGLNLDLFKPTPLEIARHDLGLSMSEKLVLFPWNPKRPEKRFDLVSEAIQLLRKKHQNARLEIIHDKPSEIVAKYMNACDALVLASDHEGSPMAIREAMACNLPIVSVDVGDVSQIIRGVQGCYLCQQDSGDLAEKLDWVLSEGRRTDGSKTIGQMDSVWSAEQVIALYQQVLIKT